MELTFIHAADMHLCKNFKDLPFNLKERETRRKELWETFDKIIDLAAENEVGYLFISGDLICSRYGKLKDFQKISGRFNTLKNTKIILIAGNNDPLNESCYYSIINWPDNVYIIKEKTKLQRIHFKEDNLSIFGVSLDDFEPNYKINEMLDIEVNEENINILLLHGGEEEGHNLYIDYDKLDKFNYCALGHIHDHVEVKENIIYPGTPEPLDFEEEGKRGVIMGKVSEGLLFKVFIPLAKRKFITKEIYLQKDYTEEKILDIIKFSGDVNSLSRNYYRIVFKGQLNNSLQIEKIKEDAEKYFRYVEFIEEFDYILDFPKEEKENKNNLIGRYLKEMTKIKDKSLSLQKSILLGFEELLKEKVD